MIARKTLLAALVFTGFSTQAWASNSSWVETPGGRVRVIVDADSPSSGDAGQVRGAVQVELQPGWKTYWRNPGAAGVPPQISLDQTVTPGNVEIEFPTPHYFGTGEDAGIGYKMPVSFPVTFTTANGSRPDRLRGNVFLGLCESICIPVQAEFDLTLNKSADTASAAATRTLVATAFDRLPAFATTNFGVKHAQRRDGQAVFELSLPDASAPAELFVSSDRVMLTSPVRNADGSAIFTSRIGTTLNSKPVEIDYTLVQNGKAVSGQIALP